MHSLKKVSRVLRKCTSVAYLDKKVYIHSRVLGKSIFFPEKIGALNFSTTVHSNKGCLGVGVHGQLCQDLSSILGGLFVFSIIYF